MTCGGLLSRPKIEDNAPNRHNFLTITIVLVVITFRIIIVIIIIITIIVTIINISSRRHRYFDRDFDGL